jgi:hypothetical protein
MIDALIGPVTAPVSERAAGLTRERADASG